MGVNLVNICSLISLAILRSLEFAEYFEAEGAGRPKRKEIFEAKRSLAEENFSQNTDFAIK